MRWGLAVICLATIYLGVVVFFFLAQRKLQYHPTHADAAGEGTPEFRPWRAPSGEFLGYVREVRSPRRVILFFHGNGGEAIGRVWMEKVAPPDAVIILAEYPGYGPRKGGTTEESVLAAALQAADEAALKWRLPLVVVGESLGTGVAAYVVSKRASERLALIAPYTSIVDVARDAYPFLPVGWMLLDRYPTVEYLQEVTVPLHVIHGSDDWVIPIALAKRLYDGYRGPKQFTEIRSVGHNVAVALLAFPEAEPFRRFLRGE